MSTDKSRAAVVYLRLSACICGKKMRRNPTLAPNESSRINHCFVNAFAVPDADYIDPLTAMDHFTTVGARWRQLHNPSSPS